jgi:regulator of sigma E protease
MGPAMNIILAFLIITFINISGVETEKYKFEPPVIGYVEKDSPAYKSGIRRGDLIVEIDGRHIPTWKELEITIGANPNETMDLVYQREGRKVRTEIQVQTRTTYGVGYAGFFWDHKAMIAGVKKDSPASKSGLKKEDIILSINMNPVGYFNISDTIAANPEKPLLFSIRRDSQLLDVTVTPEKVEDRGIIGIEMSPYSPIVEIHYGLIPAMGNSIKELVKLTFLTFNAFKKIIIGKLSPKNLSGPIEIAKFSQKALESGLSNFFILIAFISLQLGIINLFPIPVLDGGHLMIYSIEAATRKEFSPKVKSILINMGFIILVALMIFVILNDIAKTMPNGWNSFLPF